MKCERDYLAMIMVVVCLLLLCAGGQAVEVSGELKKWHKVTLTFDGPATRETAVENPFLSYCLDVTFMHADGTSYRVPGYYAADGDAANTSADSGSKWRVHFSPDRVGEWTWRASFRQGKNVAISDDAGAGRPVEPVDGAAGTITVGPTDKGGRDLRGKGRLDYVGERYLRFAETGEYFLKAGTDAPENFLAYDEFDATPNKGNWRKSWAPHAGDYTEAEADLLWGPQRDKGKNILGAINYLASEDMNAFSFLTFNVDGDDCNVFPHILKTDMATYEVTKGNDEERVGWDQCVYKTRFDVSKLAQWERVFTNGDRKGMYLHFKLQETEVDQKMDGGDLGPERKVYCRELVARFSHHLALNWNIGEENKQTTEQVKAMVQYLRDVDPYDHNIVVHTFAAAHNRVYRPLLGNASALTGVSIQTDWPDFRLVYGLVKTWVKQSTLADKPWVVACDEPGDAMHGMVPDKDDPQHNIARKNALWGTFMAGGAGVEWYFGYWHDESDLTCQNWRSRDLLWDQCRIALNFFKAYDIPLQRMRPIDKQGDAASWVLAGEDLASHYIALAYLPNGGKTNEGQMPPGEFAYGWFNPRTGEGMDALLHTGTVDGGWQTFTAPDENDWVLLIVEGGKVPVSALAGKKRIILSATDDFDSIAVPDFAPAYRDPQRGALAINAAEYKDKFAAAETAFDGKSGTYDVQITTLTETDGESTYKLAVNGTPVGAFTNPPSAQDYRPVRYVWNNVAVRKGDTIRVAFNSASNGKVPEGDAFAFSRGRFAKLVFATPGTVFSWFPEGGAAKAPARELPETEPFVFDYDPEKADLIFEEVDGLMAVEAEHYAEQTLANVRQWYLTTTEKAPGLKPDADESHADAASGGAYLEILPDTRKDVSEELIDGVNFSNTPGRLAILYYPVFINTPGRYYVWGRVNCTGPEDNGLHVGLDGEWPESGQRLQWIGQHGQWQWDSAQRTQQVHTGVRYQIYLDIETPGFHTIMFSMREDGFEFDKWLMTREPKLDIPTDTGPAERRYLRR